MLDYPALAAVAAVIREGSFDRAAAALSVTPSAVSQRVRTLEDRLGAVLIVRGQPCTPTTAGAQLFAHVERVRLLEGEMISAWPALGGFEGRLSDRVTLRIAVNADSVGTWFIAAIAAFAASGAATVDLILEGEAHTAERLRSGEVLAAVTSNPTPVQGCRTIALGALRYLAAASPGFARRYFADGVTAQALSQAPVLRFDRRDDLQFRWSSAATEKGDEAVRAAPTHWLPSTQAFVDAALAELGWGMNPTILVEDHIAAGRLVNLVPGLWIDVPLYWQHAQIGARLLAGLSREVVKAARRGLVVAPSPPQLDPSSPVY